MTPPPAMLDVFVWLQWVTSTSARCLTSGQQWIVGHQRKSMRSTCLTHFWAPRSTFWACRQTPSTFVSWKPCQVRAYNYTALSFTTTNTFVPLQHRCGRPQSQKPSLASTNLLGWFCISASMTRTTPSCVRCASLCEFCCVCDGFHNWYPPSPLLSFCSALQHVRHGQAGLSGVRLCGRHDRPRECNCTRHIPTIPQHHLRVRSVVSATVGGEPYKSPPNDVLVFAAATQLPASRQCCF